MVGEHVAEEAGKADRPRLGVLRRAEDRCAVLPALYRVANVHAAVQHVHVLAAERVQLAGAGARVRSGEDQRAVALRHRIGQRPHLLRGQVQLHANITSA